MINSRTVEKRDLARVYISMPNHPREYLVRPVLARSDCGSMILLQRLDMYRYQTCFFRDVSPLRDFSLNDCETELGRRLTVMDRLKRTFLRPDTVTVRV